MTATAIEDILRKIGWTDGTRVPISNAENQALEEEIERLSLRRHKANIAHEHSSNRRNALNSHLKHLLQESDQNQKFITANKEQLDSDQHQYQLKICERDKIHKEIKHTQKTTAELKERIDVKKKDLALGMSKIEKMKAGSAWDAEALKAWEESLKKRDEDNEILKKFSKQDEKKAKDLETKRLNLQIEANKRKAMIQTIVAELKNYEQIMERTGKMLGELREEKSATLNRWQDAVRNLRQRDDEIKRVNKELDNAHDVLAAQRVAVDEQQSFVTREKRNNEELTAVIEEANVRNSKIRRELNETINYVLVMNNEANTIKRAMLATAQQLEKERGKSKGIAKDLSFKEYQIKKLEFEVDKLQEKLKEVMESNMNSGDRTKYLEDLIEFEQKETHVLATELTKIQNTLYRTQQKLSEYKEDAKTKEMEIQGHQVSMNFLRRSANMVLVDLERQRELVYDLDFRKCDIEMKLAKVEGTVADDLVEDMIMKVKDLQAELAGHSETSQMLQTQINRLNDERRRLTNTISGDDKIIEDLRNKLQNHVLLYDGGLKQTAAVKLLSQKKQVEENVLRLKVDNLSKGMSKTDKHIYNLTRFRMELDTAMKERQIEILAHKDILMAQRKNLVEDVGRLKADIMGRNNKISQLQDRFGVGLSLLGKDEFGNPLSIAHFKIKSAQEKYMLQILGDELDTKIHTAEKEIVAMENTLKVVNYSNSKYRNILAPVQEDDKEVQDLKDLKQAHQNAELTLFDRKKLLKKQIIDFESFMQVFDVRNNCKLELLEELQGVLSVLDRMDKDQSDRMVKMKRADKQMGRALKAISGVDLAHIEKDFTTKCLQDCNYNAMQQLQEIPKRHQETAPLITKYFADHGIALRGSTVRSGGSSYSDDPIRSLYSSSSNRSSGDYGTPVPSDISNVTLSFDYPFVDKPSKMTNSLSVTSTTPTTTSLMEDKMLGLRRNTLSSMYHVSRSKKMESGLGVQTINRLSTTKDSRAHDIFEGSLVVKAVSTGSSINVPSELFKLSPSQEALDAVEEGGEEEEAEDDERVKWAENV